MTVSPLDRTLRESAAPAATMVARGLLPSPFDARLRPLNLHQDWMPWAGHLSPRRFASAEAEYFTIRNQATLFNVSTMHKYQTPRPDDQRVHNPPKNDEVRKP